MPSRKGALVIFASSCGCGVLHTAAITSNIVVEGSDCLGKGDHGLQISSVQTDPQIIRLGEPFSIDVIGKQGSSGAVIGKGARLSVSAQDGWFPMFDVSGDLCSPFSEKLPMDLGDLEHTGHIQCEVHRNQMQFGLRMKLSDKLDLVTRSMEIFVVPKDFTGKDIACAKLNLRFQNELLGGSQHPLMIVPPYFPVSVQNTVLSKRQPLGSTISFTWDSSCTVGGAMAQVTSMSFEGNTLGQPISITGEGSFKEATVPGTKYSMVISAMGIPLMSKSDGWCDDSVISLPLGMGQVNLQGLGCPGKVGPFTTKETLTLSSRMIFKSCSVQLSAIDPSGKQYFCVNINGAISSPPNKNVQSPRGVGNKMDMKHGEIYI